MLEIDVRSALDPTRIEGSFSEFVNSLNVAAAQGKQFVIATEVREDGESSPVAFETRNITRIREVDEDAFVSL